MNVSDLPQPGAWLNGQKMSSIGQQLLAALRFGILWLWASGPTSARPPTPVLGQLFWDTTVGGMVVCTNPGAPMSGTPATWGPLAPVSAVNSVQYGTITIPNGSSSATGAITAVGAKAALFNLGFSPGTNDATYDAYVKLTSSTVVTASRVAAGGFSTVVEFMVIDYA